MNRRSLLPLAMLLLAAAGALLPTGIAALDNARLENRVDTRPLPDIHLSLRPERGVEDTLSVWAKANSKIELSQGGVRGEQEAREAAEAVLQLLVERGLLPKTFSGAALEPLSPVAVIADGEPNSTAVVWEGGAPESEPFLSICVDDATGKLVSVSYNIDEWGAMDLSGVRVLANQWAEFLIAYYELSDLHAEDHLSANRASVRCAWELVWERDGQEVTCPFTLLQRGNMVCINL